MGAGGDEAAWALLEGQPPSDEGMGPGALSGSSASAAGVAATPAATAGVQGGAAGGSTLLASARPAPPTPPALFSRSTIANSEAVPLYFGLLRQARQDDQLWGLAAWQELLLLGGLPACLQCERAGLNPLLIDWLAATTAAPAGGKAAPEEEAGQVAPGAGQLVASGRQRRGSEQGWEGQLLQRQLASLLRLTGSYSCSGAELRALLALLLPSPAGADGASGAAGHWLLAAADGDGDGDGDGSGSGSDAATAPLPAVPRHSLLVLQLLAAMAAHEGPSNFFHFDQPPPSGLVVLGYGSGATFSGSSSGGGGGVGGLRLSPKGYSVAVWVRQEDGRDAALQLQRLQQRQGGRGASATAADAAGGEEPEQVVLSLLLNTPEAVAAIAATAGQEQPQQRRQQQQQQELRGLVLSVRAGGQLVVHSWGPRHVGMHPQVHTCVPLGVELPPRRWHHMVLSHSPGGTLASPLHRLYLNGKEAATARVRYPLAGPKEALAGVALAALPLLPPPAAAVAGEGGLAGGSSLVAGGQQAGGAAGSVLDQLQPFRGQMGCCHLFDDPLSPGGLGGWGVACILLVGRAQPRTAERKELICSWQEERSTAW